MTRLTLIISLLAALCAAPCAQFVRLDTIPIGETRMGQLDANDRQGDNNHYVDQWGIVGRTGDEVTIDLESSQFDAHLAVVLPDGRVMENDDRSPGDLNSRLSFRLPADGRTALLVSSYAPNETGAYTLRISEGMAPSPDAVIFEAPVIPISLGAHIEGNLGDGDTRLQTGRLRDIYTFAAESGRHVIIEMISTDIDSHLTLIQPDGHEIVSDDAEPGVSLDSRIDLLLPLEGEYRLVASSYGTDEVGNYTLNLRDGTRVINLGDSIDSRLSGQLQANQTESADVFLLDQIPAGLAELQFTVEGYNPTDDIDLEVLSPRGPGLRRSGEGAWRIIGSSRHLGSNETVSITTQYPTPYLVRVLAPEGADQVLTAESLGTGVPFQSGETLTGTLTGGRRSRLFEMTATESGYLVLQCESKSEATIFTATESLQGREVILSGSSGICVLPVERRDRVQVLVSLDDSGDSTDFRITQHLLLAAEELTMQDSTMGRFVTEQVPMAVHPVAGQPGVPVEVSMGVQGGEARLLLVDAATGQIVLRPDPGIPAVAVPHSNEGLLAVVLPIDEYTSEIVYTLNVQSGEALGADTITPSEVVTGTFGPNQHRSRLWRIEGHGGTAQRIRLWPSDASANLALHVIGGDGSFQSAADLGEGVQEITGFFPMGVNQWIQLTGQPLIQTGFTLQMETAVDNALAPRDSGRAERWGIFVGVSEYQESRDSLPYCSSDAIKMMQLFNSHGHMDRDHAILLTDTQATRSVIAASFAAMADRVGPEDSFVFFFSGHGGQMDPSADCPEIDQRNEYICPHDTDAAGANIIDDTFAKWLDAIPAKLTLILIDACNAGGFANDLEDVEGRIGLFASEEDLLSYTYEQYKAGGIMAHLLSLGLGGEADGNLDGNITAGEISDYILTQMPQIRISDSDHSSRTAQHPESMRTVPYDTVIITPQDANNPAVQ